MFEVKERCRGIRVGHPSPLLGFLRLVPERNQDSRMQVQEPIRIGTIVRVLDRSSTFLLEYWQVYS